MATSVWKYKYYDTPEGEDCFKKMLFTTKFSTLAGAVFAINDVFVWKGVRNFMPIMSTSLSWIGPFAAMGVCYSGVTCALVNLRDKNDYWNNAIGGFCSGLVLGAARRHNGVGGLVGAALAVSGVLWHIAHVEKWDERFIPLQEGRIPVKEYGFINYKKNYTLIKDPKDR